MSASEAAVHLAAGRLAEAEAACRAALAADPSDVRSLALLAQVAQRVGRHDVAVKLLDVACTLRPTDGNLLTELARSNEALGRHDAVFAAVRRLLALHPERHDIRLAMLTALANAVLADPRHAGDAPARRPADAPRWPDQPVSVIICSISPEKFAAACATYRAVLGAEVEIVGIHDARSLCEGYARGLAQSTGALVVFSHDDVEVLAHDFEERLRRQCARFDLVGVAGTKRHAGASWFHTGWPHQQGFVPHRRPDETRYRVETYGADAVGVPAQSLDGLFLAGRREVFETLGFDAETFDGFHLYDADLSWRAHLAGFKVGVALDLCILHQSIGARGQSFDAWQVYARRFLEKHKATLPDLPRGPNPLRAVHLDTRDQVRAFHARILEMAEAAAEGAERPPGEGGK